MRARRRVGVWKEMKPQKNVRRMHKTGDMRTLVMKSQRVLSPICDELARGEGCGMAVQMQGIEGGPGGPRPRNYEGPHLEDCRFLIPDPIPGVL